MTRQSTILVALAASLAVLSSCRDVPIGGVGGNQTSAAGASTSRLAVMTAPSVNKLYLMNLQTNRVNLQLQTGTTPTGVAVSPSGRQILVTNYNDGTISTFWREDGDSYTPLGQVGSGSQPLGVTYNPNPLISEAYVAYYGDGRVLVLDTRAVRQRPTITATITLPQPAGGQRPSPRKIAVSPDGSRIFVTDGANDLVYTITRSGGPTSSSSFNAVPSAPFPGQSASVDLHGLVATRSGQVFITNRAANNLFVFNGANNQVLGEVNLQDRVSSQYSPSVGPLNVAINPQGTKLYVAGNAASVISEVGIPQNGAAQLLQNIPLSTGRNDTASGPHGIAVTADGGQVYATNEGGRNISIINAAPDLTLGSMLFKNVGTAASASELVPLNEIAMVGEAVNPNAQQQFQR